MPGAGYLHELALFGRLGGQTAWCRLLAGPPCLCLMVESRLGVATVGRNIITNQETKAIQRLGSLFE